MGRIAGAIMAGVLWAGVATAPARAASMVVYDGFDVTPLTAFTLPNSDYPAFGDCLNLTQSGTLTTLGLTLYNGGPGSILTGTMSVYFFDNTMPYAGGPIAGSALGMGTISYDFSGFGGLPAGRYDAEYFDFSPLNIHLSQNILIVQQFVEDSGSSAANGVVLMSDPAIGTSPPTVFLASASIAEGLYQLGNLATSQAAYYVEVEPDAAAPVPLPAGAAGGMVLLAVLAAWRLRKSAST